MSGVGVHHQNTVAEQAIRTVTHAACTMLLHATIYWSEVSDLMLRPFELQYAVDIWNNMLEQQTELSPFDKFSQTMTDHTNLSNSH
eukprot:12749611-Ditylum_brightwellii.AAC.1